VDPNFSHEGIYQTYCAAQNEQCFVSIVGVIGIKFMFNGCLYAGSSVCFPLLCWLRYAAAQDGNGDFVTFRK
jgi:hypothetical protein